MQSIMNYLPYFFLNMLNIEESINKCGNCMQHSQEAAEENEKMN
jgi:hypothetical protein